MNKKWVSVFLILAFVLFTESCAIHKTTKRPVESLAGKPDLKSPVVRILMKSGEMRDFGKDNPGFIRGNAVIRMKGITTVKSGGSINVHQEGDLYVIETKDGWTYRAKTYHLNEKTGELTLNSPDTESIPLADVDLVWTRDVDGVMTALAVLGGVAVIAGGVILIVALTKDSCPFLYSDDGTGYALEGELYSGAVFKNIERGDILKLHHLAPAAGEYRLKIANEAMETQCTNELSLLVVDHAKDVAVYAGPDGRVRTVGHPPIAPLSAVDFEGRDFTAAVAAEDGRMWSSNPFDKDPEDPADWTAGLILKFPRPEGEGATAAKLAVRIGNTFWADAIFGRLFGLLGAAWQPWFEKVGRDPDIRAKTYRFLSEQGVGLKVQVGTPGGWRDAGFFHPTGPFGIKDDILELDLSGIPGDTLTVRLRGGTFFWTVDRAVIDYSADVPVQVRVISPREALDGEGKDVRPALLADDGAYFTMPEPGNFALVRFDAPPEVAGLERSFLLRSRGYYTIHPRSTQPVTDLPTLLAIQKNPDLFLKYSLLELRRTVSARAGTTVPARTGDSREQRP